MPDQHIEKYRSISQPEFNAGGIETIAQVNCASEYYDIDPTNPTSKRIFTTFPIEHENQE